MGSVTQYNSLYPEFLTVIFLYYLYSKSCLRISSTAWVCQNRQEQRPAEKGGAIGPLYAVSDEIVVLYGIGFRSHRSPQISGREEAW